jgi:signal transduction histidine kinase
MTLARAYADKSVDALRALGAPPEVCVIFGRHWTGDLRGAYDAADHVLENEPAVAGPYASLLDAERSLLSVKIGLGLRAPAPDTLKDELAALVWCYGRFSHYFWVNHREARRSLRQLALLSLRVPSAGMLMTTIFLMGHLMAIAGWSRTGFAICRLVFATCFDASRSAPFAPTRFSEAIVFAAYPYSAFVSGRFAAIRGIVARCQPRLAAGDPYYATIFVASALYAAAYTADVARADVLATQLGELHASRALLRYAPLARIMPLLPVALRGYTHLVRDDFDAVVQAHDTEATTAVINSHFFRAAALIALSLGDFARGEDFIARAITFRRRSKSFHAWRRIDARLLAMAVARTPLEPGALHPFGAVPTNESSPFLGELLLRVVQALPAAYSEGMPAFEDRVLTLLQQHLDCPAAELRAVPAPPYEDFPQLKVGNRFVVCIGLPPARVRIVERLVATITPVLAIIAASIRELLDVKARNERMSRDSAIASTAQMMAHDLRRPFGILAVLIERLKAARTSAEMAEALDSITPEVERASSSVRALIADVMELGRDAVPSLVAVAPERLVDECLADVLGVGTSSPVTFEYRFSHDRDVLVDPPRIQRVFANIVGNAIEAMPSGGTIRFETASRREQDRSVVEFVIANDGPPIPPGDVGHVFDLSYTRSKRGGTGFGLAIAQRIVASHGGRIACRSGANGVEFRFTLPAAPGLSPGYPLPACSSDVAARRAQSRRGCALGESHPEAAPLDGWTCAMARPLRVWIIDSDPASVKSIRRALTGAGSGGRIELSHAASVEDADAQFAAAVPADLVIVDPECPGSALPWLREQRAKGLAALVCVHGHDPSPTALRAALVGGADRVIPKTMSAAHLARLVVDAGERTASPAKADTGDRPEIAVVDDSPAFLLRWRLLLRNHAKTHVFESPETFIGALDRDPPLLERLRGVITDQRFDTSSETGFSLARALHARRPCLPIALSSSAVYADRDIKADFVGVLDKEVASWPDIVSVLQLDATPEGQAPSP